MIEPVQSLRLAAAIKAQRGLGRSHGQDLEADLGDQAQRAPAARHQARDVIAGHILHDLAAVAQQLALAVDHLQAQHKVTYCAHAGTRRAGQACGDHAAHGAGGAEVRRLESQALALAGQCCLQLGQRRAGANGHHQLAGLVADDTAERARGQRLALQTQAVEVLAAAAADAQRGLVTGSGANALAELIDLAGG